MRLLPSAFAALILLMPAPALLAADAEQEGIVVVTESGEHPFQVEIADEPRERSLGLMFRREMGDDEGMLFDFGVEEQASFWMQNTYISLDMLFIREDGTIESIAERTTPLSEKSVLSKGPVRYVLEINGGLSDTLGIDAGDKVSGTPLEDPP